MIQMYSMVSTHSSQSLIIISSYSVLPVTVCALRSHDQQHSGSGYTRVTVST